MAGPEVSPPVTNPKTTGKTTAPGKRTPAHGGGKLNTGGTPGNKGGTGRPPNWIREQFRRIQSSNKSIKALEKVAQDSEHPAFSATQRLLALYAMGLPAKAEDTSPEDQIPHVSIDI